MNEQKPSALEAKWAPKLAEARRQLEEAAAKGDENAIAILRELDGEPVRAKVNAPIPGPPAVRPWNETDREPGEEG